MPQASDELREQMRKRFGDPVSDSGPTEFLKSKGYILRADWCWEHPTIKTVWQMPEEDFECLLFLVHEWDFGGLVDVSSK